MLAILFDMVVAVAVAYFVAEPGDLAITAFWIWLAIQAAALVLGLLTIIRTFALYKMGAFNPARDNFLTALVTNNFPAPQPYEQSVDYYLTNVVENDELTVETRLAAASLYGARQGVSSTSGLIKGMLIDSAHEEALKAFKG